MALGGVAVRRVLTYSHRFGVCVHIGAVSQNSWTIQSIQELSPRKSWTEVHVGTVRIRAVFHKITDHTVQIMGAVFQQIVDRAVDVGAVFQKIWSM